MGYEKKYDGKNANEKKNIKHSIKKDSSSYQKTIRYSKKKNRSSGTLCVYDLLYIKCGSNKIGYRPDYILFQKKIERTPNVHLKQAIGYNRMKVPEEEKKREFYRRDMADIGWHVTTVKEVDNSTIYSSIIDDVMKNAKNFDSFIFFTGSSELYDLMRYLKEDLKKRVIVVAFEKSYARSLWDVASSVVFVDHWFDGKKRDFKPKRKNRFAHSTVVVGGQIIEVIDETSDSYDKVSFNYQYSQGPIYSDDYPDQYIW